MRSLFTWRVSEKRQGLTREGDRLFEKETYRYSIKSIVELTIRNPFDLLDHLGLRKLVVDNFICTKGFQELHNESTKQH